MFTKILIANRGEIACRVIATCRRLGIRTVAVYSEADASARHVRLADEAHCVGPAASRDSYLRVERILEVAKHSGAQAIHPGYGFLSENAAFAQACADAGIVFIGPPAGAIRAMGSKSAAKALMDSAGVPLVPGFHGDEQDAHYLHGQADQIGYPVLIKASAGGGGKGMRIVERSEDFRAALASCQREARSSFGDERVLIEKYLVRPRHIEIQVFADMHGNVIHLHERDCSAQRRHQKVVEEAPAPGMSAERRAAMGKAACDAARAVGYVGAGTVEFIADSSGAFYFMEMNTRLQVEHPVTEMITGQDLVEWQLRIAAGEPLPLTQDQVPLNGHAIEVRVYAEEPEKGFLPSIGRLAHYAPPTPSANVRIDSGVEQGDEIGPHYDPMIAKLIVWDAQRARAIERMLAALADFRIVGVGNNLAFLSRLVDHPEFRAGRVDTGLIERARDELLAAETKLAPVAVEAAALWTLTREAQRLRQRAQHSADSHSPWGIADGWRMNGVQTRRLEFAAGALTQAVEVEYGTEGLKLGGQPVRISDAAEALCFAIGEHRTTAVVVEGSEQLHVFTPGRRSVLRRIDPLLHAGEAQDSHGGLVAPMPGKIVAILAAVGADVEKGTPLLVMEAMKMEHTLCAPSKGRVRAFLYAVGDQVKDGVELIDFEGTT
ncbi:acetyl/propionyl/methylcrotonyl-CoA carboxylase subunit alpha [Fontimonas sp. SYSU GA230001]|uniref:acetyl/propionyl/methylcrotonyl-CoA carboxylase subunit alpha n=1 Tax=Fontimonas sp. SYSU GA230001 TaxID=3142450 RepID=UPI0032B5DCAA